MLDASVNQTFDASFSASLIVHLQLYLYFNRTKKAWSMLFYLYWYLFKSMMYDDGDDSMFLFIFIENNLSQYIPIPIYE